MLLLACVRGAAEEVGCVQCCCVHHIVLSISHHSSATPQYTSTPQVSALIELGAHVDAVDKAGYSAMHFAAAHGRTETLKLLWSKGGELEVEDQGL